MYQPVLLKSSVYKAKVFKKKLFPSELRVKSKVKNAKIFLAPLHSSIKSKFTQVTFTKIEFFSLFLHFLFQLCLQIIENFAKL